MTTPRSVTETVPDPIRAREPSTVAHLVQRQLVLASIIAVPDKAGSRETTYRPALNYPSA